MGKTFEPRHVLALAIAVVLAISSLGCPARYVLSGDKTLVTDNLFYEYGLSKSDILGLQFYLSQDVELVVAERGNTVREFDTSKDNVALSRTDIKRSVSIKAGTPGIAVGWEVMQEPGGGPTDYIKIDFGSNIILYFHSVGGNYSYSKWSFASVKGDFYNGEVYQYPQKFLGELEQKAPGGFAYLYCDLSTLSTTKTIESKDIAPGKRRNK